MFDALARLANSRPWRVLGLTLVGFVIAGVLGGPVAGLLNSDSDSFSDNSSDSALAVKAVEEATGQSASPDLLVLLDADDRTAIKETKAILHDNPSVAQVVGGKGARFTSTDKTQTYVGAFFAADADADAASEELVDELDDVDGALVGGPIPAFQEVNDHVESDLVTAELIAFPLLFLASLWVFRSAVAALLPLLVGGLTIVISLLLLRGIN
jgi:RND superfamily putative drug exporter